MRDTLSEGMSRKGHKSNAPGTSWVKYGRSYLVTLGLVFIGVMAFLWKKQGDKFSEWPLWFYFVSFGLPILGLVLIGVGLLASGARIEKWADGMSRHEASIVVMILALPVFLVMSVFEKRKP